MIYKLDTDFTQIDQKEGLMQNLSHQAYIEVVSCEEDPRKDSGIILMPLEKLNFKAKKKESVFARSAHIGGTPANISVVNFNVPASGSGAGVGSITYAHTVLDGYVKADGSLINREEYLDLFEYADTNGLLLPEADWANSMQGMYGVGDDSTTFRVPDLRAQFLRGLDDGAEIDTDRILGSAQVDTFQGHRHHSATYDGKPYAEGIVIKDYLSVDFKASAANGIGDPTDDTINGTPRISKENRPKNIALIAQIKY